MSRKKPMVARPLACVVERMATEAAFAWTRRDAAAVL